MDRETRNNALYFLVSMFEQNEKGLTLKEIQHNWKCWSQNYDHTPLAPATFKRYRKIILNKVGINIQYVNNVYKIVSVKSRGENTIREWGISVQAINCRMQSCETISDRILLEPLPSSKFLDHILLSLKNNNVIEIDYREYGSLTCEVISIEPYCIKTYHNRWYILGKRKDNELKTFCMDRIEGVKVTDETFHIDPHFNAKDFFSEYFAVRLERSVPMERVILRAHENERYILDRQPIHPSQKKRSESDKYWDFEYHLRPTFDFVSYLESQGRFLEVKEPQWLRRELNRVHIAALEQNKTNDLCLKYNPNALSVETGM